MRKVLAALRDLVACSLATRRDLLPFGLQLVAPLDEVLAECRDDSTGFELITLSVPTTRVAFLLQLHTSLYATGVGAAIAIALNARRTEQMLNCILTKTGFEVVSEKKNYLVNEKEKERLL